MYAGDLRSGGVGEFRRSDGVFLGWVLPGLRWDADAAAALFVQSLSSGPRSSAPSLAASSVAKLTRQPVGLCLSPDESQLAVTDKRNSCVVVLALDGSGAYNTVGSLGTGDGQLSIPVSVAFTPDGNNIVVADAGKMRLQVLAVHGPGRPAPRHPLTSLRLADPAKAVCVDGLGNILLATASDFSKGKVQVFNGVDGSKMLDRVGGVQLDDCSPSGLALDRQSGTLAVVDFLEGIDNANEFAKEGSCIFLLGQS
jgi:DNA-binding beta-propeller fold protein YncE